MHVRSLLLHTGAFRQVCVAGAARPMGQKGYTAARSAIAHMRNRKIFGSHLYNQIVGPLLLAALVVAITAFALTVFFLRDLTDKWVSQVAETTTTNLVGRYQEYSDQMLHLVKIAADSPSMRAAANDYSAVGAQGEVAWESVALDYDNVMLLDEAGTVLATSGMPELRSGSKPLGTEGPGNRGKWQRARSVYAELAGQPTLTALQPLQASDGTRYTLALTRIISDRFVEGLASSNSGASAFFGPDSTRVAFSVSGLLPPKERSALTSALAGSNPEVSQAIADARGTGAGTSLLRVGGINYQVRAQRIMLPGDSADTGESDYSYMVGIVSQQVSDEASRTTMNLIILWSICGVVALVALGGWVARGVSVPLNELAGGARRIADGDFSTKVDIQGTDEIATLAESFNDMTSSLQDRSESLTKKVLELATLYEMSRALGSTLDMDELLGSVLDSALRIFDLDLGYVALRDKESGVLSIRAMRGRATTPADAVRSSMSEWVVREGRPLIFNPDKGKGGGQIDVVTGAKAALCVPLVSAEGTIGSVTVGSSRSDYRFNSDDVRLLSTIANHVTIAVGNIELFTSLQEAYLATVRSLAAAVDAKDTYTRGHSDRVSRYSTLIAERMGLAHEQCIALEMAAYLHDIGKIGVSEEILLKPGCLTEEEMAQMRHHPLIGANILKPVAFPWAITPVVRHHHEHFDGTGYPAGLKGDEIPLLARILCAADSYEAMTADRPYRAGRSAADAIAELRACSGKQFDPRVVDVLAEIVDELELTGDGLLSEAAEEIAPEEARAIFAALADGVFASFRRLGGPRLASNVEVEVDAYFRKANAPFRVVRGRVTFTEEAPLHLDEEVGQMRTALRRIDAIMGRVSGTTLVDHFYSDALDGFSARMRHLATVLDFHVMR